MDFSLVNQILTKGPSIAADVVKAATDALSTKVTESSETKTSPTIEEKPKDSFTDSNGVETTETSASSATPTVSDVLKAATGYTLDELSKTASELVGVKNETDKAESNEGIATSSSMARNDVKSNIESGVKTASKWLAQGFGWAAKAIASPVTAFTQLVTHPTVTKIFSNITETFSDINDYFIKPVLGFFTNTCRSLFGNSYACKAKREAYQAKLDNEKYYQKQDQQRAYDQKVYEQKRNALATADEAAYEKQVEERKQIALSEAQKRSSETPAQKMASSFGKFVDSSTTMVQVLQDLASDIPIDKLVMELEQLGINVHAIKDQMDKLGNNGLFKEALVQIMRSNGIDMHSSLLEKKATEMVLAA